MKGLEPPRPETLDPKSNAATNYATCAGLRAKVGIFLEIAKFFLFGGGGSFWKHSEISECSECSEEWAEGGGPVRPVRQVGQVRRVRRVRQVGLLGERGGGREGEGDGRYARLRLLRGAALLFWGIVVNCCYCCCCFLAVRAVCIEVAAARPSPIARITVAPPRTMSPPA